ncbi:MAG: hypothetical protein HLUCCA05_04365 [Roseibaca calidilacus]|uniref:Uncharacterized protein n=1 Tax=Roseibaca calidilacus TaxID=1666912 RepID=A0A0N8K8Z5_9RHOB|nr:hypothetical protein [Roseibaca calidilacus]KPP95913.1 MAG: hypothetical protein HLUCCA05_04365 [Roseibaca calidilacus]CUX81502.1 hypothetical protein Ga0058931_1801 [Roseibaca calidilacus]
MRWLALLVALLVPIAGGADGYLSPRDAGAPRWLGMNLTELRDYQPQRPFVNVARNARPWMAHRTGQWGGFEHADLRRLGAVDARGWPRFVPEGASALASLMLVDLPETAGAVAGNYRVTWTGQADAQITGRVGGTRRLGPNTMWFSYTPGPGHVELQLRNIDPDAPIRDIAVVHQDHVAAYEAGEVFNPDWLARVDGMAVFRFMEWMNTNYTEWAEWDDRAHPEAYTYTDGAGVPLEVMIRLANDTGTEPWFTIPHLADDGLIVRMAETIRDQLDPGLRAWIEFSNETWNWSFPQANHARTQAQARWGNGDLWQEWNAMRAAQMVQIFDRVFDGQRDRLVRVLATQTGWHGLEEQLTAPSWQAESPKNPAPPSLFDAYAITGYFSGLLGNDEKIEMTRRWLHDARAQAEDEGRAQGLSGDALARFTQTRAHDILRPRLIAELRDGAISGDRRNTVASFLDSDLPYHKAVADRWGLELVAYEGGTHLVGVGSHMQDSELTALFMDVNYSQGMAELYTRLLEGWVRGGGGLFAHFTDIRTPGRWGSFGALRHLTDRNPRWDALVGFDPTKVSQ